MKIKGLIDESFVDYRKPAMYIAFPTCSFKCDKLNGCQVCQNCKLASEPDIDITKEDIIERYLDNPITQAIVLSGLEPLDSVLDVISFVDALRNKYRCNDDVVIFTGYTQVEVESGNFGNCSAAIGRDFWDFLRSFPNMYVKFGRYVMGEEPHKDEVLGISLASSNQYGVKISNEQV
jgi:hypothetical protein